MRESHCNKQSNIADSLAFVIRFPRLIRSFHVLKCSGKKNLRTFFCNKQHCSYYTYSSRLFQKGFFFSMESLNLNKLPSLQVDLKTKLSSLNFAFSSILLLKRVLKSSEDLTAQGNTHTICSLGTVKPNLYLINNLSKTFLMHESIKLKNLLKIYILKILKIY